VSGPGATSFLERRAHPLTCENGSSWRGSLTPRVDTAGFTRAETDSISESRWMTPKEITELRDIVALRGLAELLPPILAGDYPSEPIDVGI